MYSIDYNGENLIRIIEGHDVSKLFHSFYFLYPQDFDFKFKKFKLIGVWVCKGKFSFRTKDYQEYEI